MKRITVLLVDDNTIVRKAFRKVVEDTEDLEVLGEAKNGAQAVAMAKNLFPDVVLMDITMPVLDGLQATRQLLEALPETKVLMLSVHSEDSYVTEAVSAGAKGYLVKLTAVNAVCPAIREVHRGNSYFSPSISSRLRQTLP
jgi:DNA-binding NarL/FixJ family response regulator